MQLKQKRLEPRETRVGMIRLRATRQPAARNFVFAPPKKNTTPRHWYAVRITGWVRTFALFQNAYLDRLPYNSLP